MLAVFPKQSAHAIPKCYWKLYEPDSDIIDFYPHDIKLDINGARYAWMGVNILPFIDSKRLKSAINKIDQGESLLTEEERKRNKQSGDIYLFLRSSNRSLFVFGEVKASASFENVS